MELITWDDKFSVDVEEMDNQHKDILRIVNELYASVIKEKSKETMDTIFTDLTEYAKNHFKAEEDYFEKFNYSESESHKQEHVNFANELEEFKKRIEQGEIVFDSEIILRFLLCWFINHVLLEDKKYTKCFNDNGLR